MAATFRILPAPPVVSAGIVEAIRACASAHLSDCMGHVHTASDSLMARHAGRRVLCGQALTVHTAPGDNLIVQKALDLARPGDIIVVDGGGFRGQALVGEIMATHAARRGIAGFIVDGAVRDLDFLLEGPLPVWSTSVTPRGRSRNGPGAINVPVRVAGMSVSPGDIVLGDLDGVVTVPLSQAARVLDAACSLRAREASTLDAVMCGQADRSWIDAALEAGGCESAPDSARPVATP